jgi:hypothetical protein
MFTTHRCRWHTWRGCDHVIDEIGVQLHIERPLVATHILSSIHPSIDMPAAAVPLVAVAVDNIVQSKVLTSGDLALAILRDTLAAWSGKHSAKSLERRLDLDAYIVSLQALLVPQPSGCLGVDVWSAQVASWFNQSRDTPAGDPTREARIASMIKGQGKRERLMQLFTQMKEWATDLHRASYQPN